MKKKLLTTLIVGTIFYFLGRYLYLNWQKLTQYEWQFNVGFLLISFIILLIRLSITVGIWKKLLNKLGSKLSYKKCFKVWFMSLLGKYLPGRVWASLGRIYLAQAEGVPKRTSFTSLVYEYSLSSMSAFIFGVVLLLIYMGKGQISAFMPFLYFMPFVFFILHPKIFSGIANFILNKLKKEPINLDFTYLEIFGFMGLYLVNWLVMALAFYYFVNSIYPVELSVYPVLAGMLALSILAGFLCFFVPAGLGVREGVLTGLLSIYLPLEIAIVIAIGSRIWITLGELTGVGLAEISNLIKRRI